MFPFKILERIICYFTILLNSLPYFSVYCQTTLISSGLLSPDTHLLLLLSPCLVLFLSPRVCSVAFLCFLQSRPRCTTHIWVTFQFHFTTTGDAHAVNDEWNCTNQVHLRAFKKQQQVSQHETGRDHRNRKNISLSHCVSLQSMCDCQ